jgi:predicted HTH transcriptional regulator
MSDTVPQWADLQLSIDLPKLRAQGEGEQLEFKVDFPPQAHDLAAEIAAFASSGGGVILIGVSDDGSLSSVPWADALARDGAAQRAHGIARSVRPDVKVKVRFAVEGGQSVLCIVIPPQSEPVYYSDGRPYIRDDRVSRRATPEEVKQLVWRHPSSDHRRKMEELNYQQTAGFIEDSRRQQNALDEMLRRSQEQHNAITAETRSRQAPKEARPQCSAK